MPNGVFPEVNNSLTDSCADKFQIATPRVGVLQKPHGKSFEVTVRSRIFV